MSHVNRRSFTAAADSPSHSRDGRGSPILHISNVTRQRISKYHRLQSVYANESVSQNKNFANLLLLVPCGPPPVCLLQLQCTCTFLEVSGFQQKQSPASHFCRPSVKHHSGKLNIRTSTRQRILALNEISTQSKQHASLTPLEPLCKLFSTPATRH
jgi:hypothetical protein